MKEGSNPYKLMQGIIGLSNATSWEDAKNEWVLSLVYEEEEGATCLCGHHPIKEICVVRNKLNGKEAIVGNVCVKKFLGLPSDRIFSAIQRISKDNSKSLNIEAIKYMYERGWLNEWEYKFYCDNKNRRKLTESQIAKKIEINQKLLQKSKNQFSRRGNRA